MSQQAGACDGIREALFLYLDGEAEPPRCAEIQAHLDACPECRREYEQDAVLKSLVRRSCGCEAAPEPLRERIMARISGFTVTSSATRVVFADGDSVSVVETRTTTVETWDA